MMKHLYLLRHAKSSWSDTSLDDHDRPLARRGKDAARDLARYLRREGIRPAIVLCSSSRRTRQTLKLLRPALDNDVEVRIEDRLYLAGAEELLRRLHQLPKRVPSALIVGHNPGVQDLALTLARASTARARLQAQFPTGALASLKIRTTRWRTLRQGDAKLVGFHTPRQLG